MITIDKNLTKTVKVYLNQENLNEAVDVTFRLQSPSRSTVYLIKSLTKISTGFYSFQVTAVEGSQLIDDSYYYQVLQNDFILKKGKVRLTATEQENLLLDLTLDATLS